jgi:nicotinamide-nucleotide amidase
LQQLLPIAEDVATLLKSRGETVAVAESSTGGLIAAALVAIPGASAYFVAGGVIYTAAAQRALLQIPREQMQQAIRASTEPYALLAAQTIRARLGTDWGIAETGASGPTGNRYGDAAGHSCIAVAGAVERAITLETGRTERVDNMWQFARAALLLLQRVLAAAPAP